MKKRKSTIWSLSKEEIQEKVNMCNSISDMLEIFGYKRSSGSMAKVMKEVIKEYDIDVTHFRPFRRINQQPKYKLEEILIPNSPYRNINKLKKELCLLVYWSINVNVVETKVNGMANHWFYS